MSNIDISVGNTLQDPMHDDLDQRLPIDGLIDGLRIANKRQHVTGCDETSTPSCSTAIDTHVKHPRRQLQFAAGTIGVINKECNSAKDTAADNLCFLCNYEWPPNMKGKTASWVQCNSCKKWFHLLCLRMKRKEIKEVWQCDDCQTETA